MTFVKPSSNTTSTGAFKYKGYIPNPSMNYIDNSFPNILDKTGDTISGVISLANLGGITGLNGSTLTMNTGSTTSLAGTITLGGTLSLTGALSHQSGSTDTLLSGSTFTANSGSTMALNGTITSTATITTAFGASITLNATPLTLGSGSTATLGGAVAFGTVTTAAATYSMGAGDTVVFADTTAAAVQINLPAPATQRIVFIKDFAGTSATHNITISAGGNQVDGASTKLINTQYGAYVLYSNGANWYTLAKM